MFREKNNHLNAVSNWSASNHTSITYMLKMLVLTLWYGPRCNNLNTTFLFKHKRGSRIYPPNTQMREMQGILWTVPCLHYCLYHAFNGRVQFRSNVCVSGYWLYNEWVTPYTTVSPLINAMLETYVEVESLNWYCGAVSDALHSRIFPQLCLKYSKHFAERVAVNDN